MIHGKYWRTKEDGVDELLLSIRAAKARKATAIALEAKEKEEVMDAV
jgi:hypothetical protein